MNFRPFVHAIGRKETGQAGFAELRLREFFLQSVVEVPQFEVTKKIGLLVGELAVRLVGLLLAFQRSFARVLDLKGGGDDQRFR